MVDVNETLRDADEEPVQLELDLGDPNVAEEYVVQMTIDLDDPNVTVI